MEALEAPPGQKATSPVYLLPPAGHQELHVQFKSRKLPAANMTEQEKKKNPLGWGLVGMDSRADRDFELPLGSHTLHPSFPGPGTLSP